MIRPLYPSSVFNVFSKPVFRPTSRAGADNTQALPRPTPLAPRSCPPHSCRRHAIPHNPDDCNCSSLYQLEGLVPDVAWASMWRADGNGRPPRCPSIHSLLENKLLIKDRVHLSLITYEQNIAHLTQSCSAILEYLKYRSDGDQIL